MRATGRRKAAALTLSPGRNGSRPQWLNTFWREKNDTTERPTSTQDHVRAAADAARLGRGARRSARAWRAARAWALSDEPAQAATAQSQQGPGRICRSDRQGEARGDLGARQGRPGRRRPDAPRAERRRRMPPFMQGSPFEKFFRQYGFENGPRARHAAASDGHRRRLRLLHLRRRLCRHQQSRRRPRQIRRDHDR